GGEDPHAVQASRGALSRPRGEPAWLRAAPHRDLREVRRPDLGGGQVPAVHAAAALRDAARDAAMIEADDLAKRFGDVEAVRQVTFTAPDGAITGLLGPNGAGKTTTLRMISTLVAPTRGAA